jgi:hypothetical protein
MDNMMMGGGMGGGMPMPPGAMGGMPQQSGNPLIDLLMMLASQGTGQPQMGIPMPMQPGMGMMPGGMGGGMGGMPPGMDPMAMMAMMGMMGGQQAGNSMGQMPY